MRGIDSDARRGRLRAAGAGALALALTALLGACGGGEEEREGASEQAGDYPVQVVDAQFPVRQRLAQTSRLRLALRNAGEKRVPALVVSVSIGGAEGQESVQPFSVRDPQPDLSLPYRPVWVLEESYPRELGQPGRGGAQTSDQRTFDFGPLDPGETAVAVWKVTAVRAGDFPLRYVVEAGLGGKAQAVAPGGGPVTGVFPVKIFAATPPETVNEKGEVVIIRP